MPAYSYRAVDCAGRVARGRVAAANEWELAQNLSQSGFELIEARAKKEATPKEFRLPQRLDPYALADFASHTTDLLRAGIPFPDAIQEMAQSGRSAALRDALHDIHRAINHGSGIAEAFTRRRKLFPDIFIAIMAAGEKSGDLVATFSHLARYAQARAVTISQLRKAVRYPVFLLAITVGVIAFMTTMVIPPIVQFLDSLGSELPLTTRIMIGISALMSDYWWAVALIICGALSLIYLARRYSEDAARRIDGLILHLPLMGPALRKFAIARFAHSFTILFQSGAGVVESLHHAGGTLGNRMLLLRVENAEKKIQAGRPLSTALSELLPSFAVHMIRIGERSGSLAKALDNIATACDREVNDATTKLIGAMEPFLTLVVGSMLAWIVLAVLGPIYGNIAKISSMM